MKIKNMLSEKSTNWKIWYAIFPFLSMLVASFFVSFLSCINGVAQLSPLLQFIIMAVFSLGCVTLISKKFPTSMDLGFDTKTLSKRNVIIILSVFVITHLSFFFLSKISSITTDAKAEFTNTGFGNNSFSDLILIISTVIFAPIFEEIVYRGIMLRSIHDGMLKHFPKSKSIFGLPAITAITITAIAFILPHVANLSINVMTLAYFITSAGFSVVYLLTGSMVAAMVSHSLQSAYAFSNLLIYGHGDYKLSPIIYLISFGAPVIAFVIGEVIRKLYNKFKL